MPELPEVETVRKGLQDRLDLFRIEGIQVFRESAIASPGGSKEFKKNLRGTYVGNWERRGKYLIASLYKSESPSIPQSSKQKKIHGWWVVHLRMTGQFQWHEQLIAPCPYTRVSFWTQKGYELRFVDIRSFGQMWWIPANSSPKKIINGLRNLGPEPFSEEFNASYLQHRIKGKKRPIKSVLLDQTVVAGIGNIYADESLFSAGILPTKSSGHLSKQEIEYLCHSIVKVLKISIGKGGTTFSDFRDLEGINGKYGGQAWVYRRGDKPCRKCGTKIQREKLSGRSTHWCPTCQN